MRFFMKKTNKITILMLTGILSLGLINNATYAAAAKTPEEALFDAAKNGDVAAVRTLLDARVNVDAADNNGMTALMEAAGKGNNDVAALLIQARAHIDAADNIGVTALME